MAKNTTSSHLVNPHLAETINELEKAFADWEKLTPESATLLAAKVAAHLDSENELVDRARELLVKLNKQIRELEG